MSIDYYRDIFLVSHLLLKYDLEHDRILFESHLLNVNCYIQIYQWQQNINYFLQKILLQNLIILKENLHNKFLFDHYIYLYI